MSNTVDHRSFVERHNLHDDMRAEAEARAIRMCEDYDLSVVRLSFADQHGVLRGKTIMAQDIHGALDNGITMTTTLLAKDTAHRTTYPVFTTGGGFGMEQMSGGGDFVMIPDPTTFKALPWASNTGWMLCDIYFPNGDPVPFSTRQILRDSLGKLADQGYDYVTGLEVEFHLFKLEDPKLLPHQAGAPGEAPEVSLLNQGYQYLTESRADDLEPYVEVLRDTLMAMDLPLRTTEVEFGPSQLEFTFHPQGGLASADTMMLFRSAVKQTARRAGLHASFMCRPNLPNIFSSGWHLHQSLVERGTSNNAFMPAEGEIISPIGKQFVAGLLDHAQAASVFSTPTINGYKRYQPYSLAPDRALWGYDNRGAMIRVVGGPGDAASRIENRVGEPAANPYLYLASQIVCGLDGMARQLDPSSPVDAPYDTEAPLLPTSLLAAIYALKEDTLFRREFGDQFVDYILHIKEAEVSRFHATVTDWEHKEYFGVF
ncbi:MAG: glutamine synthetase [Alphaproteobacteria bacterium]|jgi:glutamine synthetase|nr:glutamine synthetase [Alphaproteobacteria bacterium]MBT4016946.1 glutamine synthetase [Alphaproteobacteria bacterium]MBT4965237.1 glutamine synthetase [Alphaproteobacteria bacterium]MBT5158882.1 glutamine synthetase [Alphaproteobacteria bacterium]MBT5919875.1 glutamine synthetase [Alphaproteobacteria bacterium]